MGENSSNSSGTGTNSQPSGSDTKPVQNNKKKNDRKKKGGKANKPASSFTGSMNELNGHVFEVHYETTKTNQFTRTCEEIRKYVSRKYE